MPNHRSNTGILNFHNPKTSTRGSNIFPVSKGVQGVQGKVLRSVPSGRSVAAASGRLCLCRTCSASITSRLTKTTDGIIGQIWSVPLAGSEKNAPRNSPCDAVCAYLIRSQQATDRCVVPDFDHLSVCRTKGACAQKAKGLCVTVLELSFMWIDSWNTQEEI